VTRRILVVDDDRGMVTTLCDIFALHGWETVPAHSGAEAIRIARETEIPLVLMDIKMEGMNGVETLKALKARHPNIRVVLMTAYTAESLLDEADREGVFRVLPKPLDINHVMTVLEENGKQRAPVLIVDHDAAFLNTLADVLRIKGFETVTAFTLDDAVLVMRGTPPAAVLLHLRPGEDVAASIAAVHAVRPNVAVLMYSARPAALADARATLPPASVQAYFAKPLPVDELTALLNDLS